MALARMRTIKEAVAYIKEHDPKSAVGESWIRRALKTGKLPYAPIGWLSLPRNGGSTISATPAQEGRYFQ